MTTKKTKKNHKSKKTRRMRKMRKTHKKRGGSTAADVLANKGIPQGVIDFEVSKFLTPVDKTRLYETNITIENFKKIFNPDIQYSFVYDADSHNEYGQYPYDDHYDDYELTNTRFAENTKKRMDACVKDDAMGYLFRKYGDDLIEMNGENIDVTPVINVKVQLTIREYKGQYQGRLPADDANILINYNPTRSNHNVNLFTDFGIDKTREEPRLLRNCRNVYAHVLR